MPGRHAEASPRPRLAAANTVATTRPPASTAGPPELPGADLAPQRRHPAPDGPVAVGVLADHGRASARAGRAPPGRGRSRDSRGSRPALRPARRRRCSSAGAPRPGTRSTATSLCGSKTTACASSSSPPSTLDRRVVLTRDDVRVRDHDARARPPTPIPATARPQAVPRTRTTLARAACTSRSARMPARRRRDVGLRAPGCAGNGSTRASAFRIGPDGGSSSFSRLRIAERWMSCRSSRAPGVCSATAPAIQTRPEPERRDQHGAADAVDAPRAARRRSGAGCRRPPPRARSRPAPPTISAPMRRRAARRASSIPPRAAAAPSRLPANAPAAKPGQRERAHDQALRVAPERHQRDERDDDPVDRPSCGCYVGVQPAWRAGSPG